MTSSTIVLARPPRWADLWRDDFNYWFMTSGLRIVLLLLGALLTVRFVNWVAKRITYGMDARFMEGDDLVRSEATKHRQAMASVFSWVLIGLVWVVVALAIVNVLKLPTNPLAGPAAVVGAGIGFGARSVIEDMIAGFLVIAERQYGFGDLVQLELSSTAVAVGTVEDVTLRVTRLRSSDGEAYTIPNGKVVKTTNLSKDWARAVVDIPVPTSADLAVVNEVLHQVCETARDDEKLGQLLLDAPSVMGVESIQVATVTLRMVARTLPGRQFEAGRQLRALVLRALGRIGIVIVSGDTPPVEGLAPAARVADPDPDDDTSGLVQKP
jgi:small conductance mechanosensitive channel